LACLLLVAWVPKAAHADASWWNADFAFRKSITVDSSPAGANLTQPAGRVPLLIRLHSGNFQFDGVADSGADIRFVAADDKTPLHYQIENFDPVLGVALVWVDVPAIDAGTQQSIWMYYGNPKAPEASQGAAVFDADYSLVYHFEDAVGTPPKDATAYANSAQGGRITPVDGIIGKAAQFDGTAPLTLPASVSLNTAAGGTFTFSSWVKVDTLPTGRALLYARRQNGAGMVIGLDQGAPFVEVDGGAAPLRSSPASAIKAGQWTHVAVTATDGKMDVYVNGQPVATLAAPLPALTAAAVLGGDVPAEAGAAPSTDVPFVGQLDEVRLSRIARPVTLLQLDAMAQGAESKLVRYAEDEKQAGMGFGYFGIIVKSVTADAWSVIGVLLIMALISWVVMWQRAAYVGKVTRANEEFLERFRGLGKNILGLGRDSLESAGLGGLRNSSLYRLYEVGTREVWSRRDEKGHTSIAAESIEAIRATMDSTLVRENQALSKSMVLLTIAISGGPFLGLLGTVVGVMITFAAIAAAGDVNVNAIAPGIAAALLATVAGLFVAIPALFGYNYLLIRNKNVTANMQVFVDEFVTRLAELHRSADQSSLG
jgi:biopolymer transport protein ExbB